MYQPKTGEQKILLRLPPSPMQRRGEGEQDSPLSDEELVYRSRARYSKIFSIINPHLLKIFLYLDITTDKSGCAPYIEVRARFSNLGKKTFEAILTALERIAIIDIVGSGAEKTIVLLRTSPTTKALRDFIVAVRTETMAVRGGMVLERFYKDRRERRRKYRQEQNRIISEAQPHTEDHPEGS